MAISVDWPNRIVFVPKADTLFEGTDPVSGRELRALDTDFFRNACRALEDDDVGRAFPITHDYNGPVVVGGVPLAPVIIMINGYAVEFEDGPYRVRLNGSNSNIADVAVVNQVQVVPNNSAGQTFSEEINAQSFLNASVYIDVSNGNSGTQYPRGTPTDPSDNFADAKAIADFRNLSRYVLTGALSMTPTDDAPGSLWVGKSPILASIVFSGSDFSGSEFTNMALSGVNNGGLLAVRDCRVSLLSGFCGTMRDCLLQGNITVDPACVGPLIIAGCSSGVPGTARPTFDLNGADSDFQCRGYFGGLTLEGLTKPRNVSIDIDSGTIEVGPTCTAGVVVVGGVGRLIDNSGPGCTVDKTRLVDPSEEVETGITLRGLRRLLLSAIAGPGGPNVDGDGKTKYRSQDGSKVRIEGDVDANGVRTNVTLDGSG